MENGHGTGTIVGRNVMDSYSPLQSEVNGDYKQIILNTASPNSSSGLGARARILRASDVLLSLAGRKHDAASEKFAGIENFQETLRIFPPLRNDDGTTLNAADAKCPDCDAIFSADELKQHYLTRFCPGTAVAVYVMTRDRLITKGYRLEKRFIPLDSCPLRFFCEHCESSFTAGDKNEVVERSRDTPPLVICKKCGEECNISYEPVLNDPRDSLCLQDFQKDRANVTHSRSPSIAQMSFNGPKFQKTSSVSEEHSLAQRARKLRDSWSFRKLSQCDENELIGISFAGLYDLEKVHAPNGIFQQYADLTEKPIEESDLGYNSSTPENIHIVGSVNSGSTLKGENNLSKRVDSRGSLVQGVQVSEAPTLRRQSFLQRIFGRSGPKDLSRTTSTSTSKRGRKLIKRVNTVRFYFTQKGSKNESGTNLDSEQMSNYKGTVKSVQHKREVSHGTVSEAEYMSLLRGSQNIFVHVQHLSGGAVVHDASGRQRLLEMDEVARVFLQLKNELSAAAIYSQALMARFEAETASKQGNSNAAVVEYHNALQILESAPALDSERLCRASILHSMGQSYHDSDMPAKSRACYLEALGLYKRSLGRDHPTNFTVLHDFGALHEKDGYATEAAALYERSFAGRLKTLGQHAPETLSSMQDLASLKVSLGDMESALLLLERAVPALDTVFGLQNKTTLNAMNELSLLYQKLGLDKQSRLICGRIIPHCRTTFGLTDPVTRDAILRYIQSSENFDFPPDITDVLDQYQSSRDADALHVVHRLGRAYMDAGLNRDAAAIFETLFEDLLIVKGPEAPETFDALSALCVSREHLGSVDKAILAYQQLVQMAYATPDDHHSRKRIGYAQKRIGELNQRREALATERKEWELHESGFCENCASSTKILCNTCKISRFCSELCHKSSLPTHRAHCIPSVSLRESKSLAVKPRCPASVRDQALSKLYQLNRTRSTTITTSYTYSLDPRNFTTFRMKLSSTTNTLIIFSLNADIAFTTLDCNPPPSRSSASTSGSSTPDFNIHDRVQWLAPQRQETICYVPSETLGSHGNYLLVTPGKAMFQSLVDQRVQVRGANGEKEHFRSLKRPDNELIEYAQGLLLDGYVDEAFMYVFEWDWK